MSIVRFEITQRGPYRDGQTFGRGGAYVRIDAIAHYAVDPAHTANSDIVDLARAGREADGLVHFSGDVTLLVPREAARGNRALLVELPNRGHRIALRALNMAPLDLDATARLEPGDGWLLEQGWCIAWCGWQWDVPRGAARIGLEPPYLAAGAVGEHEQMQLRIQPDVHSACLALTDQHVGSIGAHRTIAPADLDDPLARLVVRDAMYGPAQTIARERWRFAREIGGEPHADDGHVWLAGGFEAGRIYDVLYRPARCPVVGAGLLALRDLGAFLLRDEQAPSAGRIDAAFAEGISQCGRFLRTFLFHGKNIDEAGQPVYAGVLAHVAGARRGEFNHRFAQPSVQPTPGFGHLFPFADAPQADPYSGLHGGLLDRQRALGGLPKIFFTDSAAEYWRGDAALAHLDLVREADIEPPAGVRRYLFASSQHQANAPLLTHVSPFGSRGANAFNLVDWRVLYRALLEALRAWTMQGIEPPVSRFPRLRDGTAGSREAVLQDLRKIPGLVLPDPAALPAIRPLDLGPAAARGIARVPARVSGAPYPCVVAAVDADGNERAGIRTPDLAVPLATYTGFNPRDPATGGAGQLLEYLGSSVPFARDEHTRLARGDPRPSIAQRYGSREAYAGKVREAACALVAERLLLARDVPLCVELALARYDLYDALPAR